MKANKFKDLNSTNKQTAGKWGDYQACDSPGYLVENLCNQVYEQHPVSYVVVFCSPYIISTIMFKHQLMNTVLGLRMLGAIPSHYTFFRRKKIPDVDILSVRPSSLS